METRKGNHVDGKLTEIAVELAGESEAAGGTANGSGHQMVKITIGRGGKFQSSEADIIKGFVIEGETLVSVLDKLVDGEGSIVRLYDSIGHFRGRDDGKGRHNTIRIFLTDLGNKEGSHAGASSTTHRVSKLEALETIARLCFLADNVKDGIDELSTFSIVTLRPIVTSTSLAEHEVIRSEKLAERTRTDGIHGTGLKVHKDSTGDVTTTSGFVEINVDAFELEIGISVVSTSRINAVLIGDDFPKLGADLVTALAGLDVDDFSHLMKLKWMML